VTHARGANRALLTPELADRVVTLLRASNNANVAMRAVGVHRRSFDNWVARGASDKPEDELYRSFRERVEAARAEAEARSVAQVAKAAGEDWRAAAWLLERTAPERWGKGVVSETEAEEERAKAYAPAAEAARAEAVTTLMEIGEAPDLSDGAVDRYADAVGVWRALEDAWKRLGQPATALGGATGSAQVPHPLIAEIASARREAAHAGSLLGLDPQSRRKLAMRVAGGRPQGAASAADRAAPPLRRTLRSVG